MADGDETPESLRAEIDHLRQLAKGITDRQVLAAIEEMIMELERRARACTNGLSASGSARRQTRHDLSAYGASIIGPTIGPDG